MYMYRVYFKMSNDYYPCNREVVAASGMTEEKISRQNRIFEDFLLNLQESLLHEEILLNPSGHPIAINIGFSKWIHGVFIQTEQRTWAWVYNTTAYEPSFGGILMQQSQPLGKLGFERVVGADDKGNNCDGLIDLKQFREAFLDTEDPSGTGVKPGLLSKIDRPIFAVVDHNSAHHMAYILARKAFSQFSAQGRKKVVINFDNHADAQPASGDMIQCKSWAWQLGRDQVINVYVVLGAWKQSLPRMPPGQTQGFINNPSQKFSTIALSTEQQSNIPKIMNSVATEVNKVPSSFAWANADVYITVDRDFMKGSFTPYGDGEYEPEVGRTAVTSCLGFLKEQKANLVGFDVTGLPTVGGYTLSFRDNATDAFDRAVKDIAIFYQAVNSYTEPISTTLTQTASSTSH